MTKKNDMNKDNLNTEEVFEVEDSANSNELVDSATESTEVEAERSDLLDLDESQQIINTLTEDLQRTRADFENYQKRTAQEKEIVKNMAVRDTVSKILPVIDIIEQSTEHIPEEILDTAYGKGMSSISKKIEKQLKELGVEKIQAVSGDEFNPELHNAIQIDEEAEGDKEVIADVLQSGYKKGGEVVRYSMVRVTRK